jgi:pyrroloquinoline quinone biosynthesis protein D
MPKAAPLAPVPIEKRPILAPGCRLSDSPGQQETLLLPESVLVLNASGLRILSLCNGQRTIAQVIVELESQFPAVEQGRIRAETLTFLTALAERRALDLL